MTDSPTARADVRRVAAARLISLIGTDASAVALSFGIYQQTRSATWLSVSLLLTIALGAVFGPVGGVLGDRFDRRRLIVTCELLAAACFAGMALTSNITMWLVLSVAATLIGCVIGPAAAAAIPNLAGEQQLAWANSLVANGSNFGKLIGRVGGGALVAVIGVQGVFALDALSFLAAAVMVLTVRGQFGESGRVTELTGGGARPAAAWLWHHPTLRLVVASSCICTLMTSFSMTAETPLVFEFGAGSLGLGLLTASWAVGMLAGSWYAGRSLHAGNEATAVLAGRVAMALALALVALCPAFWPVLVCYAAGGAGGGFLLVAAQNMMQREIPDELRARVFALADSAKTAALGVGVICAGTVIAHLGPQTVYGLVGVGVLAGVVPLARLVRALGGARSLHPREARRRAQLAAGAV